MTEFTRQFIGQTLLAGGHFTLPQAVDKSSDLRRMIRSAPLIFPPRASIHTMCRFD